MSSLFLARWSGYVSIASAIGFVVVVSGLHFMQHDYDPQHQLMSELALGRYGWAMLPAFVLLAVSVLGVAQGLGAVRASVLTRAILGGAAASFVGAGVFRLGQADELHILLIAVAFVLVVLGMYLLPSSAPGLSARFNRGVCWGLGAATALSAWLGHSVLPIGVGQRLGAAWVLLWLCYVGWKLIQRS